MLVFGHIPKWFGGKQSSGLSNGMYQLATNIANLTESIIAANVLVKADDSALGYFMKGIMVPPNSSLKVLSAGEKLILAPNNQLQFSADQDEALDVIISYVDIV